MGGSGRDGLEEALGRMREAMLRAERAYLDQLRSDPDALGQAADRLAARGEVPARRPEPVPPARPGRHGRPRHRVRKGRRRRHRGHHRADGGGRRAEAWAFLVAAAALLLLFLSHRGPWWFIFIALGLGLGGARRLGLGDGPGDVDEGTAPAPIAPPPDPREALLRSRLERVDRVCDRLVQDVREGPTVLREMVGDPRQTVGALRDACHLLIRREAGLRQLLDETEPSRLEAERTGLVARLEAEGDPVAREGFGAALEALDEQRRHHEQLRAMAARLEAESVRLTYTLESLHAQVLRVRGADATSAEGAGAGLRRSVGRLEDELAAVAEALEWVGRSAPEAPVSGPPGER